MIDDDCTCPNCATEDEDEEHRCEWSPDVSEEELHALEWLLDTLAKVHEKGGGNARRALLAGRSLMEVMRHAHRLHRALHELEAGAPLAEQRRARANALVN